MSRIDEGPLKPVVTGHKHSNTSGRPYLNTAGILVWGENFFILLDEVLGLLIAVPTKALQYK